MTKRPAVFSVDTRLWNAGEGWKTFPKGETDPGPAWHEEEGGRPQAAATEAGVMKDLLEAHSEIERLGVRLAAKDHDLANIAKERDDANAVVAALEQRAIAAEQARAAAEAVAAEVTRERDVARAALAKAMQAAQTPEVHDKRTLDTPAERSAVEIPENWQKLPFFTQKGIAAKLTDQPVKTSADVRAAIEAHLAQAAQS